jgi:hypothetical protein
VPLPSQPPLTQGFDDLLKLSPSRIEMWLNRHPPFGSEVLERAAAFPRFSIEFS